MPAARTTPSSTSIKKHSHSATPPSSTSGDEMSQPPKKLQKTDNAKAPSSAAAAAADDKLKRKRQSQSCDACRARKVRCARPDPPEGQAVDGEDDGNGLIPMTTGPDGSKQVAQCKHCIALGIKCTYDYQPKKRGPPNLYLRRLQEAAAAAAAMANGGGNDVNGQATPIVPSHTRTSASTGAGYFPSSTSPTLAAAATNGQMVVPSQAPSSAGYAATHSFMDTNSIAHPHHTSPLHHQHPHHAPSLPSLNTQLGVGGLGGMGHYNGAHQPTSANGVAIPTLPSLPSLTSMNWSGTSPNANGTGVAPHQPPSATSSHNPQSAVEASWLQQTHVPMHLQPSPARLSPILGHASNLNLPSSNGIGGSAAGLSSLATTPTPTTGGPIPPSRYPIAADLNGLANAVRPQSSKGPTSGSAIPAVSTGNGNTANGPTGGSSGSSHTSGTPPPTTGGSTTSTAVDPHHPHHRDTSPATSNIIGQHVHGHYSQMSGGFLPAFVRSRASSPVPGEQGQRGMQNGTTEGQFANGLGGASAVPLTPTTAAEIFPQHPLYNWSMPYKDIDSANSQLIHPPLSAFHRAHSLETIAPMPLIMHILSLFFDYVYPLTPCVHKPR